MVVCSVGQDILTCPLGPLCRPRAIFGSALGRGANQVEAKVLTRAIRTAAIGQAVIRWFDF